jgi:lysophospholipase L1-like esterase
MPRSNRARDRARCQFIPGDLRRAAEQLEIRVLLSSAAVIQWSMAPKIARDPLHGNQPDLPNTFAYVNPPNGYTVLLDASNSSGIVRTTTFAWTVTDSKGHSTSLKGEHPRINLFQGSYQVKLKVTGLRGTTKPLFATVQVQVKDVLIVAIGDSYASGEGNPVVPGVLSPQWAFSPDPAMNAENADAHRSTIAGPAQFALKLQQSNRHVAVTFVSVANSGATIPNGLLGPMTSVADSSVQLPAEITELKHIIGTRHIDVLTLTVGGNDVNFVGLVEDLALNTATGVPTLASIQSQFNSDLSQLTQRFAALAPAIHNLNPGLVLQTGYPDLTHDQTGQPAAITLGPLAAISLADSQFTSSQLIAPLDHAIAAAANQFGWTLVTQIYRDFNTHGYPSTSSWFRTPAESLALEGNVDGSLHPNAMGHLDFANDFLAAFNAFVTKTKKLP